MAIPHGVSAGRHRCVLSSPMLSECIRQGSLASFPAALRIPCKRSFHAMTAAQDPSRLAADAVGTAVYAGLAYLRWSQMVPLLVAWAVAVITLLAALFIGFQEEGVGILVWLNELAGRVPGLREWLGSSLKESGAITESGGLRLTDEQIIPAVTRGWAILAAVLLVFEWLWRTMTGRESAPLRPLRRKLLLLLVASGGAVALVCFGFAAAGAGSAFSPTDALLAGGIAGALLFMVSAYSLVVTHAIAKLQQHLDAQPQTGVR